MRWVAAVIVASLAVSALVLSCYRESKRRNPWAGPDPARYTPARWEPTRVKQDEVRIARVRVYGDHELRAQSPSWNRQFSRWLDNANQVLVPEFGVRLEVVDFQPWTRQSTSDDLESMLQELEERDSGADVEWVVGMVSALARVTPSVHELGLTRPLGRHIVLRGHSDLAERKALGKFLDYKESLFEARREHKQASLILHEIGHTLGALHVPQTEKALLHPAYNIHMSSFATHNVRLMEMVLEERLRTPDEPSLARERRALALALGDEPWNGWRQSEFQEMHDWLADTKDMDSATLEASTKADQGDEDGDGIPDEARMNFARVQGLMQQKQFDAAWAELENLMNVYPANVAFREFACRFWLEREGAKDAARRHCIRVGELAPGNPMGDLALATAYARADDMAQAHAVLQPVLERMSSMGSKAEQQAAFDAIVGIYIASYSVTFAAQAVANAPAGIDTSDARAFITSTRRRYGLPPDGTRHGITPEREGAYVRQVRAVLDATYSKRYAEANKLARAGLREFRDGPGFSGALCDLEYRQKAYAAARQHCAAALRHYGEASWSRYLMGILELRSKRNRAGIDHLRKAIESDPDLKQAYHALYQAYARVDDKAAQSELRALYYERFGTPLPAR